ncbi:hypothetical protein [Trichloromonas sp.]|uniref:hypothetical protein n=1 Tax=Trichloromonas sp. TaxID=3069249 RepID=UPI002A4237D1|nr:hypothetical protein [Trichloromonas sp.]
MKAEKQKKVKENAGKLAEREARLSEIQGKIDAAKAELAVLGESATPKLKRRHEDMMADAALGSKDPAQAERLKNEIEAEAARDLRRENLAGLVAGLERKRDEADTERRVGAGKYREAILEALEDEAQELGAEYMAAAVKVCATFRRLAAITQVHAGYHGGQNQFGPGQSAARFLSIPAFRHLAAFEGHVRSDDLSCIDIVRDVRDNAGMVFQRDVEAERARLTAAGFDLDKAAG